MILLGQERHGPVKSEDVPNDAPVLRRKPTRKPSKPAPATGATNAPARLRNVAASRVHPEQSDEEGERIAARHDREWNAERLLAGESATVRQRFDQIAEADRAANLYRAHLGELNARPGAAVDGEAFMTAIDEATCVWGRGSQALWVEGEGCLITGPQGVGKSTIAQQIVKGRLGLLLDGLFGYPVAESSGPVLYLAMDRPAQIARSMARMFTTTAERSRARERLIVWGGPLPFDPVADPDAFATWIARTGRDPATVVVDSYKDLAPDLSDEGTGSRINSIVQRVVGDGRQWLGLHHHRKATGTGRKPNTLDDVYGSGWLTAGLGSVVLLWGQPGARTVELTHLKQPMEPVGPLTVDHSHATGAPVATDPITRAAQILTAAEGSWLSEAEIAATVYGGDGIDTADRKRARRLLDRLAKDGVAMKRPGKQGGAGGGGTAAEWRLNT
jgi:AAA domain